ncbi:MAG TPA: helix-turn-helix domain-containing protein [Eoetvoesiella sp.]|uniref:helix-turn-helix domain-containing protein n=1 Tax=Eoetvoesiella sp. TaxID=1966355 RepID=UPI002C100EC9|nr:helix-turn-helix domain-containing protein [Eoetvoesiella sp.]HWK60160.1 helix-turn-helix domain-containing protein [Eoetvoesiella sp.]
MPSLYSTSRLRNKDPSSYWQDTISRTFVPCVTTLPSNFRGAVSVSEVGAISCHHVAATRHRASRSAADIGSHHKDVVLLTLVTSGVERVVQDGREVVLRKGDFAFHDSTRPYSLYFDTEFSQVIYQIPRSLLRQRLGSFERYTAVKLSSDEQVGKLTSSFLLGLSRLDKRVDPLIGERLVDQTVDLLAMAFSSQRGPVDASRSSHRAALLYRAKLFIESRLRGTVASADVAELLGCSARYVNDLFADEGMSVGNYVLQRRLEKCRDDLVDNTTRRRVSQIAYGWGFNSIAHFSRAFRARYGMSPTDYRVRHGVPAAPAD